MPIKSRWTAEVPNSSLQTWVFGSSFGILSGKKAFVDPERPTSHYVSFEEYRLLAKQISVGLNDAGLKPGERVLVVSGNSIFFPVVFMGILMAGGIFTGANPGFVPRELAYQLKDSGAKFMIAAEYSIATAIDAAEQVGIPVRNVFTFDMTMPGSNDVEKPALHGTRHWTELLAPRERAILFDWVEPSDSRTTTCCLNYSSGTTGVPKGVEVSHYGYVANGIGVRMVSSQRADYEELRKRSVALCILPMYHVYGQTYFVANFPQQGTTVYVMPSFNLTKMLSHIQTFKVTHLATVPPILVAIAKVPIVKRFDLSSVEYLGCGAASLAPEATLKAEAAFPRPDTFVRQGWGMTEVTCTCLAWDGSNKGRSTSVGEVMPNCQAKLVSVDGTREITEANIPGELWVTGPTLMRGYWQNPEATAQTIVIDPDGTRWLKTGDSAYVESYEPGGLFHIVDRIKELIKVKGKQVAPAELEALLLERADITDAGVVGVSIDGEEVPRAYVVRSDGSKASETEIIKWIELRVAAHKRLKGGVAFTDAIPKNPVCSHLHSKTQGSRLEVG
jgi:acyl-CoA synthetase (AMP-forming)/AMP-acid ligase II